MKKTWILMTLFLLDRSLLLDERKVFILRALSKVMSRGPGYPPQTELRGLSVDGGR